MIIALIAASCLAIIASCSQSDKYGEEETYYDINGGDSVYFDGKGNALYCGLECTYEIKDNVYYITGEKTVTFNKVKDGILVSPFNALAFAISIGDDKLTQVVQASVTKPLL